MGALPIESASPAATIENAFEQKKAGNALSFLRLQHALSGEEVDAVAHVLTGLTYFTAELHEGDAGDLHELVGCALRVNFKVCCEKGENGEYVGLDAFEMFVLNLASAHAGYVEGIFEMFARRVFVMGVGEGSGMLVKRVMGVIGGILKSYGRAGVVLVGVLRRWYPHAVRGMDDHIAYARAVLGVARRFERVRAGVLGMVFEKLGTVEALVGGDVLEVGGGLTKEAEKLEGILMEVLAFIDGCDGGVFESIYAAFEGGIVPVDGTRFVGYVVLYAAMKEGRMSELVERLRVGFFDAGVGERLREKFLQHSSAFVIRAEGVKEGGVVEWVLKVAGWLNRYVDVCERRGGGEVDADVHHLFYCAACALMMTVAKRKEAFLRGDVLHRMRLLRIMSSGMNPMLVCPREIVEEFVDVVSEIGGMDLLSIAEENQGRFAPSRTRYGSPNRFLYTMRCPDLELPTARKRLAGYIRYDDKTMEVEEDEDDDNRMDTDVMPFATGASSVLATEGTHANRFLSTSVA